MNDYIHKKDKEAVLASKKYSGVNILPEIRKPFQNDGRVYPLKKKSDLGHFLLMPLDNYPKCICT